MDDFNTTSHMTRTFFSIGRCLAVISTLILLTACQALTPQDDRIPLQTEAANLEAEIVMLQTRSVEEIANAQATFDITRNEIAAENAVNQQLLATLSIRITPTPRLTTDNRPDDWGLMVATGTGNTANTFDTTSGDTTGANTGEAEAMMDTSSPFLVTGMATTVRASDGCVETTTSQFSVSAPRVYATFVANNLQAGTALRVDWVQNGEVVYFSDWTPDSNYPQICVWFYITSADVPFTPGPWAARVLANNQIIEEIPFTFDGM